MRYEVLWPKKALGQLATIWATSPDRPGVTASMAKFDSVLTFDPLKFGESRDSSLVRVAYSPPLGIEFSVIEDDKRVVVQGVFAV